VAFRRKATFEMPQATETHVFKLDKGRESMMFRNTSQSRANDAFGTRINPLEVVSI
jgi:hypothetical protein